MIIGDIVTDSESDDPDALIDHSMMSDRIKQLIGKHRKCIKRQKQQQIAKLLVERCLLCRKVTKKLRGVLEECPKLVKKLKRLLANEMWELMPGGGLACSHLMETGR